MRRHQRDQGVWDVYQLVLQQKDLDGPAKAALLERWDAEQQRKHERQQDAAARAQRRFEISAAVFVMISGLSAQVLLVRANQPWIAVALIAPLVVLVAKFPGRPVTKSDISMVALGIGDAFQSMRQAASSSPPPPPAVATASPAPSLGAGGGPVQ
ncbi:hypothetical protein AB0O91_00205 [Kitasatospora sp. NPDC089797]|uniref:hypothetical protein n=1 Tax=Kitasatospora sp. NPDC089797 TaxID=3155298 RepID=UPI00342D69CF